MSWSTTVLLSLDLLDDEALAEDFSNWLRTQAPRVGLPALNGVGSLKPLHDRPDAWGGWRIPEARIWGGVTTQTDVGAVVDRFARTPWRHPEHAQLMIQDEDHVSFTVWMIHDGDPRRLVPEQPSLATRQPHA